MIGPSRLMDAPLPIESARGERFDHGYHRTDDSPAIVNGIHDFRNAVTFGFRSEVFHQKCNSLGAKDRHKDDKRAPRARRRMRVGIIRRGRASSRNIRL